MQGHSIGVVYTPYITILSIMFVRCLHCSWWVIQWFACCTPCLHCPGNSTTTFTASSKLMLPVNNDTIRLFMHNIFLMSNNTSELLPRSPLPELSWEWWLTHLTQLWTLKFKQLYKLKHLSVAFNRVAVAAYTHQVDFDDPSIQPLIWAVFY